MERIAYRDGLTEYVNGLRKDWDQKLRERSFVHVSFIVKFYPDNGEIRDVVLKCKLPCSCEECAFKNTCYNIKRRILLH